MPKLTQNNKGGVIIWDKDDWMGGYVPQGGRDGVGTAMKSDVQGLSYMLNFDPYRNIGYAQPSPYATTATNAPTQLSGTVGVACVPITSSYAYVLTGNGKILEYNYSLNILTNAGALPYSIAHGAHTTFSGSDMITYHHNVGGTLTRSVFYSFNDNTDWDVGTILPTVGSPTFNDDFMSTVPDSPMAGADLTYGKDYPHPMAVGQDDVLYMGSGRYLHAYNGSVGTNGTFYSKVLSLPQGFIITCLLKRDGYLMIGGIMGLSDAPLSSPLSNEAGVYVWNYLDQDVNSYIPCNDGYISSLVPSNGAVTAITAGYVLDKGGIRIKQLNGDSFQTIADLPTSEVPLFRGVDSVDKVIYINSNGVIYSVGSQYGDTDNVNQIGTCQNTPAKGFVKNVAVGTRRYMIASSTATLDSFGASYADATIIETPIVEPLFPDFSQGRITKVTIYFKGTSTSNGRTLTTSFLIDNGTVEVQITQNLATIAVPLIKKYEFDYTGKQLPFFKDIFLRLSWGTGAKTSSPIVSKVEVHYELVDYQSGQQT